MIIGSRGAKEPPKCRANIGMAIEFRTRLLKREPVVSQKRAQIPVGGAPPLLRKKGSGRKPPTRRQKRKGEIRDRKDFKPKRGGSRIENLFDSSESSVCRSAGEEVVDTTVMGPNPRTLVRCS